MKVEKHNTKSHNSKDVNSFRIVPRRKDKNNIINEIVDNASIIMENRIELLELIAKQYEENSDAERAEIWRQDIPDIKKAIDVMRRLSGTWA